MSWALTCYRCLVPAIMPLAALYLLKRSIKQPDYRLHWGERFAWSDYPKKGAAKRIWIHAVSVGETNATRELIDRILKRWPDSEVLLTHMTPTGRDAGAKIVAKAPDRIAQCFLPYDAGFAVKKFLRQTQPDMVLLMETEVWPMLLHQTREMGIPTMLVNGRLSDKSLKQMQRVESLMREAFKNFSTVCAQADSDAQRFRQMGVTEPVVTGSLKFDLQAPEWALMQAHDWKAAIARPQILFASSRQGEEEPFLKALAKSAQPSTLYWLVPRHPQRFHDVQKMIEAAGLTYQCRSQLKGPSDILPTTQVILGDSMGEMFFYCALADVCIMGGSFEPLGCQNVIEPASVGVPVIVGPSTFNFSEVVKRGLQDRALMQVASLEAALTASHTLLANPQQWQERRGAARHFSGAYLGATDKTLDIIETVLCKK